MLEAEVNLKVKLRRKRRRRKFKCKTKKSVIEEQVETTVDAGEGCEQRSVSKQESQYTSPESRSGTTKDDAVLRSLIRRPRYFDHRDAIIDFEGRPAKNGKKPCYICGDSEHSGKKCKKRRTCLVCKQRGHIARDCPNNDQECSASPAICLRCGESGHDLFSCSNEYSPDDLKKIQCYVCKEFGHLCCATFPKLSPSGVSCYNCGDSGHSGLQCTKSRGDRGSRPPRICYKCGEEGHVARKCMNTMEVSRGFECQVGAHVGQGCVKNDKAEQRSVDVGSPGSLIEEMNVTLDVQSESNANHKEWSS